MRSLPRAAFLFSTSTVLQCVFVAQQSSTPLLGKQSHYVGPHKTHLKPNAPSRKAHHRRGSEAQPLLGCAVPRKQQGRPGDIIHERPRFEDAALHLRTKPPGIIAPPPCRAIIVLVRFCLPPQKACNAADAAWPTAPPSLGLLVNLVDPVLYHSRRAT